MFVHPGGEPELESAFSIAGVTYGFNGFLALRVHSHLAEQPLENPSAASRVLALPWARLEALPDKSPRWSPLDDASGPLWRYGPRPIWERTTRRYHLRTLPAVEVGLAAVTTLPLMQLLARLPRARVWTDNKLTDPIFCRWNGGDAIILPLPDFVESRMFPSFRILSPPKDYATGAAKYPDPLPPGRPLAGSKPTPPAKPSEIHYDDLPTIVHD